MFSIIKREIDVVVESDPAARRVPAIVFLYPGFHSTLNHRLADWFYTRRRFLLARLVSYLSRFINGIEIRPGAVIGKCCL